MMRMAPFFHFRSFLSIIIILIFLFSIFPYNLYVYGLNRPNGVVGVGVYKGRPFPIHVKVEVSKGSGDVEVRGVVYDKIFYFSLKEAVYEATFILGYNPFEYNYIIYVSPGLNKSYFTGTSLSFSTYLATLSSFMGIEYNDTYMVTGTLNPDSTIGFVGDVYVKATGAWRYNYSMFVYPMSEDYVYKVTKNVTRIGPYTFYSTQVATRKIPLETIPISHRMVGHGIEGFVLGAVEGDLDRFRKEALKELWRTADVIPRVELLKDYFDLIYDEIAESLSEVRSIYDLEAINLRNPELDMIVTASIENITSFLSAFEDSVEKGFLFTALKYLILAYGEVKYLDYLLLNTYGGRDGVQKIYMDYLSIESRVFQGLRNALNRKLTISDILSLSYASRLYVDARQVAFINLLGLQFISSNNLYNRLPVRSSICKKLSWALMRLIECEAISLLTNSNRDGIRVSVDYLNKILKDVNDYSIFIFNYMVRYSIYTRVSSDIVSTAGGYLWRYKKFLRDTNYNETIYLMAGLNYLTEVIATSQLYFNLHPGITEIYVDRYYSLLSVLPYYLSTINSSIPIVIQENLETSLMYTSIDAKISYLEKVIAFIKVYHMIKAGGGGGEKSLYPEVYTASSQSTNVIESDYHDIMAIYTPWIIFFTILIIILGYFARYLRK
jgi:predicted S18 family serine protease